MLLNRRPPSCDILLTGPLPYAVEIDLGVLENFSGFLSQPTVLKYPFSIYLQSDTIGITDYPLVVSRFVGRKETRKT